MKMYKKIPVVLLVLLLLFIQPLSDYAQATNHELEIPSASQSGIESSTQLNQTDDAGNGSSSDEIQEKAIEEISQDESEAADFTPNDSNQGSEDEELEASLAEEVENEQNSTEETLENSNELITSVQSTKEINDGHSDVAEDNLEAVPLALNKLSFSDFKNKTYELSPVFDESVLEYKLYVPENKNDMLISTNVAQGNFLQVHYTDSADNTQTIDIQSDAFDLMSILGVQLQDDTFYVVVSNGEESKKYSIELIRTPVLSSLEVQLDGKDIGFNQAFSSNRMEYWIRPSVQANDVTIRYATNHSDTTVLINGKDQVSPIMLPADDQTPIVLTLQRQGAQSTYTIHWDRSLYEYLHLQLEVYDTKDGAISDATIELKDADNQPIELVDGGANLLTGKYHYAVSAPGYLNQQGSFVLKESMIKKIVLNKENPIKDLRLYCQFSGSAQYELIPHFSDDVTNYQVVVPDMMWGIFAQLEFKDGITGEAYAHYTDVQSQKEVTIKVAPPKSLFSKRANLLRVLARGEGQNTFSLHTQVGDELIIHDFEIIRSIHIPDILIKAMGNEVVPKDRSFSSRIYDYSIDLKENVHSVDLYVKSHKDQRNYQLYVNGQRIEYDQTQTINLEKNQKRIIVQAKKEGMIDGVYTFDINWIPVQKLTVQAQPEDAVVYVADAFGKRVYQNDIGDYDVDINSDYTVTISKYGYITQHYKLDKDHLFIQTELKKVPPNPNIDPNIQSEWSNFRGNSENNGVVNLLTPKHSTTSALYWAQKYGEGWQSAPSSPILVDGFLVFTSGDRILKVDPYTGILLDSAKMAGTSSFNITPPTYAEGMIFVAHANGKIQAFNAKTLESLWIYEDLNSERAYQPNSPISYKDGFIYTGFWQHEAKYGNWIAISIADEDPTKPDERKYASWSHDRRGGFYWAGAYVSDNFLLVGTDDGESGYTSNTSAILSIHPITGEIIDSIEGLSADIRSTVVYDKESDAYYFTSKGEKFYQVRVNADGTFVENSLREIDCGGMSTSSPVVYNGRAYIGVSGKGQFTPFDGHNITVIDLDSWTIAYKVPTKGYPQTSGLLTTAYENEGEEVVYVYFLDNFTPGYVRYIKDRKGQTTPILDDNTSNDPKEDGYANILFTPKKSHAQYAIASPIVDQYGTMFFKNDSGHLFALGSIIQSIEITKKPNKLVYQEGEVFDPTGMVVMAKLANGLKREITKLVKYPTEPLTQNHFAVEISYEGMLYNDHEDLSKVTVLQVVDVISKDQLEAVQKVQKMIDEIVFPVTQEEAELIKKAQEAFNKLSLAEKKAIKNLENLEEAIQQLTALEEKQKVIMPVVNAINDLPIKISKADAKQIEAARIAYDKLPPELQSKVLNIQRLLDAEKQLEKILQEEQEAKQKEIEDLIAKIDQLPSKINKSDRVMIESLLRRVEKLSAIDQEKITNYQKLLNAKEQADKKNPQWDSDAGSSLRDHLQGTSDKKEETTDDKQVVLKGKGESDKQTIQRLSELVERFKEGDTSSSLIEEIKKLSGTLSDEQKQEVQGLEEALKNGEIDAIVKEEADKGKQSDGVNSSSSESESRVQTASVSYHWIIVAGFALFIVVALFVFTLRKRNQ